MGVCVTSESAARMLTLMQVNACYTTSFTPQIVAIFSME